MRGYLGTIFVYQGFNAHCAGCTPRVWRCGDLYAEKVRQEGSGWVYEYEGQAKQVTTVRCRSIIRKMIL